MQMFRLKLFFGDYMILSITPYRLCFDTVRLGVEKSLKEVRVWVVKEHQNGGSVKKRNLREGNVIAGEGKGDGNKLGDLIDDEDKGLNERDKNFEKAEGWWEGADGLTAF